MFVLVEVQFIVLGRFFQMCWCFKSYALYIHDTSNFYLVRCFLSHRQGSAGLMSPANWYEPEFTIFVIFMLSHANVCKSAAVPCHCVGGRWERLKIACIPQAHTHPQASFRSRISKDACVHPSLCTLFLTTHHPQSFLCLYSPERWLSFTPSTPIKQTISPFWYNKRFSYIAASRPTLDIPSAGI